MLIDDKLAALAIVRTRRGSQSLSWYGVSYVYKAAIQKFHSDQRDAHIYNCSWQDGVWLAKCEKLLKVVRGRKGEEGGVC
jgi:hypothetical protein